MFINRKKEIEALDREYEQKKATFSVVYGRRRVGKTALIEEFIRDKTAIYLYMTQGSLRSQLESFTKQLGAFVEKSIAPHLHFATLEEAISFLATLKTEKKLVFVIDEYQYLVQQDKTFSSKLQKIWDRELSKTNIHLILCGSVLSMIQSEVLNYSAPLYGRRTSQFHIKPVAFEYIKSFVPHATKEQQVLIYSSFGTIPKYLNEYDDSLSFIENIEQKILNKNSYLYNEGNFLLKEEIIESASYFSILESIARGNRKIGHIASSLGVNSSYLSKYMLKLIELDIVEKEVPITEKNPLKSKMGLYKIKDKFLHFWFYYVYKNYSYLEIEQTKVVLDEIAKNFNDKFVSFAFEDIILEDILQHPQRYLPFVPKKIGRWWNNKEEIDIVAYDDNRIAFFECKWQNSVHKEQVKQQLMHKALSLTQGKEAYYYVITKKDYLSV